MSCFPSPCISGACEFLGRRDFYSEVRMAETKQSLGVLMDITHAGWSMLAAVKGRSLLNLSGKYSWYSSLVQTPLIWVKSGWLWALTLNPHCFWMWTMTWAAGEAGPSLYPDLPTICTVSSEWDLLSQGFPISCSIFASSTKLSESR